jgi:hypothetical protein
MSADVIAFPTRTAITPGQRAILRREAASLRAMSERNLGWAGVMELACLQQEISPEEWMIIRGCLGAIKMEKFETA